MSGFAIILEWNHPDGNKHDITKEKATPPEALSRGIRLAVRALGIDVDDPAARVRPAHLFTQMELDAVERE